eukprot:m.128141 g.128141  ORF g.128141 m.128141 type:complete len:769 (+) comp16385_c0_seq1:197-2503(+)
MGTAVRWNWRRALLLAALLFVLVQLLTVVWQHSGGGSNSQDDTSSGSSKSLPRVARSTALSIDDRHPVNTSAPPPLDEAGMALKQRIELLYEANPDVAGCTLKDKDALSAYSRASEFCKPLVKQAACLNEHQRLYPKEINSSRLKTCGGFNRGHAPDLNRDRERERDRRGFGQNDRVRDLDMMKNGRDGDNNAQMPPFVPSRQLRIAFMLVVNGRAVRQVKRLIRVMHRPHHVYLIHVDLRSSYMYEELKDWVTRYPNVFLTTWRLGSVWGGANLYEVYIRGMIDLLEYDWEYFFNLSETDYPVRPIEELEDHLAKHSPRRTNFLVSHGGDYKGFVGKQGLDRTFLLCGYHMFRIGSRKLPGNLVIEGASDWFTLHRTFVSFAVSDDPFVQQLRKYYDFSLLSAESFFHTLLANSAFCASAGIGNGRVANWDRKLGCQCQYKAVVDWCGCSPMVYRAKDMDALERQAKGDIFFARKFDPKISHTIIDDVDRHLLRLPTSPSPYYWQSEYHFSDSPIEHDPLAVLYFKSFARLTVQKLNVLSAGQCVISLVDLLEASVVMDEDMLFGYAVRARVDLDGSGAFGHVEALVQPTALMTPRTYSGSLLDAPVLERFLNMQVGPSWDAKERLFKRYGGLLNVEDELGVAFTWQQGPPIAIRLELSDDMGNRVGGAVSHVPSEATRTHLKVNDKRRLATPGVWELQLFAERSQVLLASLRFPVLGRGLFHAESDVIAGLFWSVTAVCSVEPMALPCAAIPSCREVDWTTTLPEM